ncbi:class I glutamine amidotransferase-like protein [Aspergillus pseudotamarii]|uniref:Class I glutamine amidotransferase-like protein n=1 Tax=Aspergillus pseudotamarii TaxID=132259 RepID=A0A5N6SW58_ASPPS|nr:class I glutamine amidotransferase-like protein [Aspergillus pseudotamarii]KAE8138862.1 class I glutamine amidotransferase-like protein [Aspergillus pseudotamarii]
MHIAIFNCLKPIQGRTCPDMFKNMVDRGLDYNKDRLSTSNVSISYGIYNCSAEEFPTCYAAIDAIIITGSPKSTYDRHAWIVKMHEVLRDVYYNHPRVKLFGACFGHQMIASALLEDYGVRVEKNPKGWEIGVHGVDFEPEFLSHFPQFTSDDWAMQRKVQFIHHDQVTVPDGSLPSDWTIVGKNDLCDVQGLFQPNRVLTYQGHAEFDKATTKAILAKLNSPAWSKDDREAADQPDDADFYAGVLVEFLLG